MAIAKIADYPMPDIKGQIVNKVKWNIKKEDAILLIHDMQIYFTDAYDKSGSLYRTLVENIRNIRLECKKYNIPVVYSAQPEGQTLEQRGLLYDFWGTGIPSGMNKQEIIDELTPADEDVRITKWRYSAFENTELSDLMEKWGKHQLIITGIYAHIGCLEFSLCYDF